MEPNGPKVERSTQMGAAIDALVVISSTPTIQAAIAETDLVWHGQVLTESGGITVRRTAGKLNSQMHPDLAPFCWAALPDGIIRSFNTASNPGKPKTCHESKSL